MKHVLLLLATLAIAPLGTILAQQVQGQTGSGRSSTGQSSGVRSDRPKDYRVGPQDLLEYNILEAPELRASLRVSAGGEVTLPLAGTVKVAGKTPHEVEIALQDALRRSYIKDPHVSVMVLEMESHPVSVIGAVKKPGVFRVAGPKTVLEVLSLAEGLAQDAGDTVIVMRGAALPDEIHLQPEERIGEVPSSLTRPNPNDTAANTASINLKELLNSADSASNVLVYPGDIVKVTRAELVYVLGAVKKPGGFTLRSNERITVLQALALAEGSLPTAAKNRALIFRVTGNQQRQEIGLDVDKIMQGKAPDNLLEPNDIMVLPTSGRKAALYRSAELLVSTVPAAVIYRGF